MRYAAPNLLEAATFREMHEMPTFKGAPSRYFEFSLAMYKITLNYRKPKMENNKEIIINHKETRSKDGEN